MVNVGGAYKVSQTFCGHVKALDVVRIPVDRREVYPGVLVDVGTDWGNDVCLDHRLFGLKLEEIHPTLPEPDILVSSRVIAAAGDPAEGDAFTF